MSKKEEQSKVQDLLEGDLVFEMVGDRASHCWIYGGRYANLLHNAEGRKLQGALRHDFGSYLGEDCQTVLRSTDPFFNQVTVALGKGWASFLSKKQRAKIQNLKQERELKLLSLPSLDHKKLNISAELDIVFTPHNSSRKATPYFQNLEYNKIINTFRSTRVALRTDFTSRKILPISKIAGVSCGQFLGYCIQATSVLYLLNKNVEKLRGLVNLITTQKLKNFDEKGEDKFHVRKLLVMFNHYFHELAHQSPFDEKINIQLLNIIEHPVKGHNVNSHFNFLINLPIFTHVVGNILLGDRPKIKILSEEEQPDEKKLTEILTQDENIDSPLQEENKNIPLAHKDHNSDEDSLFREQSRTSSHSNEKEHESDSNFSNSSEVKQEVSKEEEDDENLAEKINKLEKENRHKLFKLLCNINIAVRDDIQINNSISDVRKNIQRSYSF